MHVPDGLEETRWGTCPRFAAGRGVRSSLSVPIAVGDHTAGALNLYAAAPSASTDHFRQEPALFAARAGGAIALAQRLADAQDSTAGPRAPRRPCAPGRDHVPPGTGTR